MNITEKPAFKIEWIIARYLDEQSFKAKKPFYVSEFSPNLLLNEGIGELLDLACGLGTPTAFNAANAYLGVGDSTTAASASQTGLQASTNKAFAAMASGYPQRSGQTVTFQAVFGSSVGNFSWQEFTLANGNSDTAKNLNRKVSDQGTKVSGQVWTLSLAITIS